MGTRQLVEALVANPPEGPEFLEIPDAPGFYAWWARSSSLQQTNPALPLVTPQGGPSGWSLLYVGIAPKSADNRTHRSLAVRISRDHRKGNIGSSTFRQSVASLLIEHLRLIPKAGHDRSRLVDEKPLTAWMSRSCGLTFVEVAQPWVWERSVIQTLRPPLNLRPGFHPFRFEVDIARTILRQRCAVR